VSWVWGFPFLQTRVQQWGCWVITEGYLSLTSRGQGRSREGEVGLAGLTRPRPGSAGLRAPGSGEVWRASGSIPAFGRLALTPPKMGVPRG